MHGIFVIFINNSNEYWDFYHGTNVSIGSPKTVHLTKGGDRSFYIVKWASEWVIHPWQA